MAELTDRELLERAAKAAGYSIASGCDGAPIVAFIDGDPRDWNPFDDDGDALRLAVKLSITDLALVVGRLVMDEGPQADIYATTRRAIVRAAASLATEGGV